MLIHIPEDAEAAARARAAIMADERLSLGALGLLLVILDHAPEWRISAGELCVRARIREGGMGALRPIMDELYEHRYLVSARGKAGGGRFVERVEAFAVPQEGPANDESRHPGQVVYVIGQPGSRVAKIGTTSNLRARLRAIQTGYPLRLEVLWSCPGGRRLESWLHSAFESRRLEGEWFDFRDADPALSVMKTVEYARVMGVE